MDIEKLIALAEQAKAKAYVPYSKFPVGAALLTADGQVFTGCNIENSSFGLTNCAERTAIFKAVSDGKRDFQAIAVIADTEEYCSPCGACRQVMAEFAPDMPVILSNKDKKYIVKKVNELLPGAFVLK